MTDDYMTCDQAFALFKSGAPVTNDVLVCAARVYGSAALNDAMLTAILESLPTFEYGRLMLPGVTSEERTPTLFVRWQNGPDRYEVTTPDKLYRPYSENDGSQGVPRWLGNNQLLVRVLDIWTRIPKKSSTEPARVRFDATAFVATLSAEERSSLLHVVQGFKNHNSIHKQRFLDMFVNEPEKAEDITQYYADRSAV